MLDEQDGHVEVVADEADGLDQVLGLVGVHARRGLVEEQELGVCGQGAGDLQLSLLTVGQIAGQVVALLLQVEDAEQLLRSLPHGLLHLEVTGQAEDGLQDRALELGLVVESHHDVAYHSHVVEQTDVLEGTGDALVVDLVLGQALQLLAVQVEGTGGGLVDPRQEVEDRGLTRAVGADETVDLILFDADIDVLGGLQTTEGDTQVLGFENVVCHQSSPPFPVLPLISGGTTSIDKTSFISILVGTTSHLASSSLWVAGSCLRRTSFFHRTLRL